MKQLPYVSAEQLAALEFDYVVVGAGSAGCAIASRLAEDPSVTVALLESGPPDHHFSVTAPLGLALLATRRGPRNYGYFSVPQPALHGRRSYQPRGRGLGGSSSINGMVYVRGHRNDYDEWAVAGCHGWSYRDVLPYFRRSECNELHAGSDDNPWHGGHGPLHVSNLRSPNPFSQRFIEAALQAGFPLNHDFNGEKQEGVGLYQVTQRNGERWNTPRAFLHGGDPTDANMNGGRSRLTVLTNSQALRVVFDGRRARGVSIVRDGMKQTVRARREVVLSAGAYGSPQLLMASGIGPAVHLREFGIEVVHDLAGVGQNLQDHADVLVNKQLDTTDLFGRSVRGGMRLLSEILRYRRHRTGMVTSNFAEAGAFVRSRAELDIPDLQLHFVPGMIGGRGGRQRVRGHGYSCHVCVLRPHSRGEVRLRTPDMRDAPSIDARLLSDKRDLDSLVEGVRIVRRIFAQRSLAGMGGRELFTESLGDGDGSDDAIREFVRSHADTVFHPVGTCSMGTGPMAVVDPSLRVIGVEGLRVVDASVMPTLVGGNTNAPSIMIAEKAADMMRREWAGARLVAAV
ncbi:GMC family oxidoreductase [Paraburkholderia domus]|uniref:GMC family oxidoreductase n=1 Tax=Paraburkholderia domus TaxID=2793075 RepID=UPI001B8D3F49|nr:GMC family oxidoreductase N-terminal domain-containing protein [Paraburkholderia domus]